MVVATALGRGEVEDLESLLFAEDKNHENRTIEIERHFTTRLELLGSSILSIVDFDCSNYGIEQYAFLKKGSEYARDKGLGQKIPDIIDQSHTFYKSDSLSTVLDVDSYSPEKLIQFGYIATSLLPATCQIEFIEKTKTEAKIMELRPRMSDVENSTYLKTVQVS
jgi:hypothetical protein